MAPKMYVLAALCCLLVVAVEASHPRLVPAVFVFGDSTVDVGNNNELNISAAGRANYPHYGMTSPGRCPPAASAMASTRQTSWLWGLGLGGARRRTTP
ncbi:unnamed protein product [Urochloa humidicola]